MDAAEAIKWNVRISRALGLLPIGKHNGHSKYKVEKGRIFYSLFLMAFFLCLLPIQLYVNGFWKKDFHKIVDGLTWNFLPPFVIAVAIGSNTLNRKSLCAAVNSLSHITVSLRNHTGVTNHVPVKRYIFTFFCIWSILVLSDNPYFQLISLVEYPEQFITYCVISHFTSYVLIISSLLKDLKNGLSSILEEDLAPPGVNRKVDAFTVASSVKCMAAINDSNKPKKPISDRKVSEMIVSYRTMYHEIFETSQGLNDSMAASNFVMVCYLGVVTLSTSFNFYNILSRPTGDFNDFFLKLETIPWIIAGPVALFMLTYPCAEVTALSSGIARVVNNYLARSKPRTEIAEELHQFSTMLLHEEIHFAPNNIFKLNYSLILTISGLACSYFVVLTQFRKEN